MLKWRRTIVILACVQRPRVSKKGRKKYLVSFTIQKFSFFSSLFFPSFCSSFFCMKGYKREAHRWNENENKIRKEFFCHKWWMFCVPLVMDLQTKWWYIYRKLPRSFSCLIFEWRIHLKPLKWSTKPLAQ